MKTKTMLVVFFAGALTVASYATERPKMNVQSIDADRLLISMETENSSEMEVSIRDNRGNTVYFNQVKQPATAYNRIFDMENLENGEYSMKLKVDDMISVRKLTVDNNRVAVGNAENLVAPFFVFNGEKLDLTHLNLEMEKYSFEIYGKDGLVYKTSLNNRTPMHARYDLSRMEKGEYEVVLNSVNNDFNYRFEK